MPYPVPILSSWLLTGVTEYTPVQSVYSSVYLSKAFIRYTSDKCSLPWTPLVRILSYQSTTATGEIVLIVHDSTHKMMARFTREATRRFEQAFGQRITFESVNRLMIIRSASLKFVRDAEMPDFCRALSSLGVRYHGVAIVFLEVTEVEFYARDRISVSFKADSALIPIYRDVEYLEMFKNGLDRLKVDSGLTIAEGFESHELISDEEVIGEDWKAEWCS